MSRILAWCDAPTAHTGFGRSAQHILHALHDAGHELVQLAVNLDTATIPDIPWKVVPPSDRVNDPYGIKDIGNVLLSQPFDMLWTTFDPEVPWKYMLPGAQPESAVLDVLHSLKASNPGFKMMGWFPVDGGPLSVMEEAVLGAAPYFDAPVTMSPHVYDLLEWTIKLRGEVPREDAIRERLKVIPHGVNLDHYVVASDEEHRAAKARLGLNPDTFVILQVERNQQRKQNYLALEVMEKLLKRRPALKDKAILYQHMVPNEEDYGARLGFNLPALAPNYGLRLDKDVMWPRNPETSEDEMVRTVYAAADVFLSVSTGEGFQYPVWEALACGVPIVAPRDSAREAWLKDAPNVHLYDTDKERLVMRGGYNRRMNYAKPEEAARILLNVIDAKRKKYQRHSEEGREFVRSVADLPAVQQAWVDIAAQLEKELMAERKDAGITVPGDHSTHLVSMTRNPGMGDLILAGPAIAELRKSGSVRMRVQKDNLDLVRCLKLADSFETEPTPGATFDTEHNIEDLFWPQHQSTWGYPSVNRTDTIAKHLGVDVEKLEPFQVDLDEQILKATRSNFLEAFQVDPSSCVAICFESGSPHRALPRAFLTQMFPLIKGMGLIPLLVGRETLNIKHHGVLDLTGQTDVATLMGILANVGAVVSSDSGIMHLAAAVGTPTVGCFTNFDPDARLRYYAAPTAAIIPEDTEIAGESFPAGPNPRAEIGQWAATLTPARIATALRCLLGADEPEAPRIIKPGDVT